VRSDIPRRVIGLQGLRSGLQVLRGSLQVWLVGLHVLLLVYYLGLGSFCFGAAIFEAQLRETGEDW
jgi:hypothetical protein